MPCPYNRNPTPNLSISIECASGVGRFREKSRLDVTDQNRSASAIRFRSRLNFRFLDGYSAATTVSLPRLRMTW